MADDTTSNQAGPTPSRPTGPATEWNSIVDAYLIFGAMVVAFVGGYSLYGRCPGASGWAIIPTDIYMSAVLFFIAVQSDFPAYSDRYKFKLFVPRRTAALLIAALLMFAIISGFAGLYLGEEIFPDKLGSPTAALYRSLYTMGFSDYSPIDDHGRRIVISQLVSTVILLAGVLSVLISRLSDFPDFR
jgi:hypothetical protein